MGCWLGSGAPAAAVSSAATTSAAAGGNRCAARGDHSHVAGGSGLEGFIGDGVGGAFVGGEDVGPRGVVQGGLNLEIFGGAGVPLEDHAVDVGGRAEVDGDPLRVAGSAIPVGVDVILPGFGGGDVFGDIGAVIRRRLAGFPAAKFARVELPPGSGGDVEVPILIVIGNRVIAAKFHGEPDVISVAARWAGPWSSDRHRTCKRCPGCL